MDVNGKVETLIEADDQGFIPFMLSHGIDEPYQGRIQTESNLTG